MSELYTADSGSEVRDAQGAMARDASPATDDDQLAEPLEPDDSYEDSVEESDSDTDAPDEPDAPDADDDVDGADSLEPADPEEPDETAESEEVVEVAAHLEDRKLTTNAAEAFYGQDDTAMRDIAEQLKPEDGKFTVDLHGTPNSVEVDGRSISAEEFGALSRE